MLDERRSGLGASLDVDVGDATDGPINLNRDFADDARLFLVESSPAASAVKLHVLLARREGKEYIVMNPASGEEYAYSANQLGAHLFAPPEMGQTSIAGRQYLFTGITARVWR
jgi:hypothetical protein